MFERVKGQKIVIQMLTNEIQNNRLPGTLLFHGPDGTGKFLSAIELARVVRCTGGGSADCSCRSCTAVKNLVSKDLLIVSRANLSNTFSMWQACGVTDKNIHIFQRDVRRLLFSLSDEPKYRKVVTEINDRLFKLYKNGEAASLVETALSILGEPARRVIGIDRIREIQRYLSLRGDEQAKFVIIDGAEYMTEEAANSFLKISEDTPEHGVLILTSLKKDALKPTILSRCRTYRFVFLDDETTGEIRKNLFPGCTDTADTQTVKRIKTVYKELASANENVRIGLVGGIIERGEAGDFFDFIIDLLMKRLRTPPIEMKRVDTIQNHISRAEFLKKGILAYHMNVQLALTDFLVNNIPDILQLTEKVVSQET